MNIKKKRNDKRNKHPAEVCCVLCGWGGGGVLHSGNPTQPHLTLSIRGWTGGLNHQMAPPPKEGSHVQVLDHRGTLVLHNFLSGD